MPQSSYNLHVHHKRVQKKKHTTMLDVGMYVMAMMGPLMTIPQVEEIFVKKQVAGVSLITWSAFAILAVFWGAYAYIHNEKPLFINASANFIINSLIIIGVLLYTGR